MATWSKDEKGKVVIEFGADDLVFSNIQNTKKLLSEMMEHSVFEITMKDIQQFDSSGLQLLIHFISAVKTKGGQVDFENLPLEVTDLCAVYGIEDMGKVEKINNLSPSVGE